MLPRLAATMRLRFAGAGGEGAGAAVVATSGSTRTDYPASSFRDFRR